MAAVNVCDGDALSILVCSDCETVELVDWFCQDCQQNFCGECKDHHLRRKKSNMHDVVPLREARYKQILLSRRSCGLHPGVAIDYWCENCDSVICVKCVPDRHKKHDWCAVDDFVSRVQTEIRGKTHALRETLMVYRNVAIDNSKLSEYITHCIARLKADVSNQARAFCQEVKEMEDGLLKEITIFENKETAKHSKNYAEMKNDMSELDSLITNTEQKLESCDSALSLSNLSKMLASKSDCFQCPERTNCQPPTFSKPEYVDRTKLASLFGQLEYPSSKNVAEKSVYDVKTTCKYLKTKTTRKILALCVLDNGNIWVAFDGNRFLMLMDEYLSIIKESCDTEYSVVSMALYKNTDILFTRFMNTRVQRLVSNGEKTISIADLYPYYAKGICVNNENRLFVCAVMSPALSCKIVKMTGRGQILMEIETDQNVCEPLTLPYRITCADTGELFVVDMAKDDHHVTCLDKQRDRLVSWSWRGEGVGLVAPLGITSYKNACFVTDETNHKIYVLPEKRNTAAVLLDESTRQSGPRCITVDRKGCIWVGCNNGTILKIER
ncbi:uncharacterized protein LOC132558840 [Ylistrum balloti]|uniref:uncharacterized protein LOC132558840 n=1 Tax=Ylistrum balloti TaxID=509963 RepID=UPI00290589E5|nr:uncharacterized protein LOC132558840 [Ylistrum balloti]